MGKAAFSKRGIIAVRAQSGAPARAVQTLARSLAQLPRCVLKLHIPVLAYGVGNNNSTGLGLWSKICHVSLITPDQPGLLTQAEILSGGKQILHGPRPVE
jgi:hypothetical protein